MSIIAAAPGASNLTPVSYTHLDVYKRQTFCFKKTFLAGLLQPDMQNLEVRTNKVAEFGHLVCCDRNRWFKLPYHCWI